MEAAVDGYVLRESLYGPGRSGCTPADRGPRVPAPGLRRQVAVWHDLRGVEVQMLGEDYGGSASGWRTVGWCASRPAVRRTLIWTTWQAALTAQVLGIGRAARTRGRKPGGPGIPTATCTTGPRKAAS
ncbi:hypothetical protein [Nonomuraea sp. NPDC050783]|uniref:hypothetical protein n=1 Tax=Nonomuraea sp. NPDC050783 TaxID=3154634 RepID=UPI0034663ABA